MVGMRIPAKKKAEKESAKNPADKVVVKTFDETAISPESAKVFVSYKGKLISIVTASVVMKPGRDGGRYPCVSFSEQRFR